MIKGTRKQQQDIVHNSTAAAECWRKPQKQNPEESGDHPTLQRLSRVNPHTLEDMEDRNGISLHGPFYQDPKILLPITGGHQENRWKVTQLPDETVRILHLNFADQPTLQLFHRTNLSTQETTRVVLESLYMELCMKTLSTPERSHSDTNRESWRSPVRQIRPGSILSLILMYLILCLIVNVPITCFF